MSERHIVIVGGGFSGTALAVQLARRGGAGLRVTVIEPRDALAQGVAYSTDDAAHRINVPAARMQLSAAEEGDFDRWYRASAAYQADPAARWHDDSVWPQRRQFAAYLTLKLDDARRHSAVVVQHLKDRAVALVDGVVHTAGGARLMADQVVLAISHPPPDVPPPLRAFRNHPAVIADPWRPGALAGIAAGDRVAIIGSGLTMADMVASLQRQGHRGNVLVFSRRGRLPGANLSGEYADWPLDFQRPQRDSARGWLQRVRAEVREAAKVNLPWQRVLDTIRHHAQSIWQRLPLQEQQCFLRHLRPWWDAHRYRIAPQVSAVLEQRQQSGQLQLLAARLQQVDVQNGSIRLTLRRRQGAEEIHHVDRLIVTTGPAHSGLIDSDALLSQLAGAGTIRRDAHGLGIDVSALSQTLNATGQANPHLYVVGPAARGRFGELMGLPQVAEHAEQLARQLLEPLLLTASARCPA
ncbi:FAD/NAD(P)-binding protein [Erwinia mallotivora]|uniref:FAD/NAD(P)-binding protein n=1 Tax=Erwinia mallotivora TaxID=69222 RepID=UPI0021C1AB80|nr:FAD/NAD(P)-binding protein [Erwinia mallotivora]